MATMHTAFSGSMSPAFRAIALTGFGSTSPTTAPLAAVTMLMILVLSGSCSIEGSIMSKAPKFFSDPTKPCSMVR